MREGLRILMELRNKFGLDKNPYTFSKSTIPESHHRATDVLREFSVACGAKCPKTYPRTGLRQHLATQCQVLNLDGKEIDTLAGLMAATPERSTRNSIDYRQMGFRWQR